MASGGLDSTTLCYWLINKGLDVFPLFIDYGQHAAAIELATLRTVLPPSVSTRIHVTVVKDVFRYSNSRLIKEADLWRENMVPDDLFLPYRNLFLFAAASAYAASRHIRAVYAAFINSNHAREIDATADFLESVIRLIGTTSGVLVQMPFRILSKTEVARLGCKLGAPIGQTFSCQANSQVHCGACPNCVERTSALVACEDDS
jgi:7-cyano-7-deazaguanine synthase